ncbi:MAG: RluA family pseudouridine synthase [Anaerolineaceae bacterium]
MNTKQIEFVFDFEEALRLDKFLADRIPGVSREKIQVLIAQGQVQVNGKIVTRDSLKPAKGQTITVLLPVEETQSMTGEDIYLETIFIDNDVIVINKPAGLVVHPGAGHTSGTLVNALLQRWPEIAQVGDPARPGIVHRLDAETSGVMIVARNQAAYEWLVKQFKSRKTIKRYITLVDGQMPTPTGRIEAAVGRHEVHRQKMAVRYEGKGRKAISEYHTLQQFNEHSLLEVRPITGRTHQIRVHLAYIGNPVVGDKIYGRRKSSLPINRFFLHAASLEIVLPGQKEPKRFEAPLPEDLNLVLKELTNKES